MDYEPPQCLAKPLDVPSKLLMGAGPSNAAENVLRAGALPLLGHLHTEFVQVLLPFNSYNDKPAIRKSFCFRLWMTSSKEFNMPFKLRIL